MALPTYTTTWEADDAIAAAFHTYWSALTVRTRVTYDNIALDTIKETVPIVSDDADITGEGFLQFQIQHADGSIASLGTKHFRHVGIVTASLFVENNRGRRRSAGVLGDNVLKFFQTVNVAGVTFASPRRSEVGADGRWWHVNLLADFQYDVIRS